MHKIKELRIWTKAMALASKIYEVTRAFPPEERFGLTSQIRRSAVSIPSNISEGAGRNTKGEFKQFLGMANGSCYELQTQLIIAEELGFISKQVNDLLLDNIDELQKMNYNLQQKLTYTK